MNLYHFSIVIRDADPTATDLEDQLFEAGCDDALLCQLDDTVYLEFDREAPTAQHALQSAIDDLHSAGFHDLIIQEGGISSLAEMAERIGVSRTTMSHYAHAKRGQGNFPKPIYGVASGSSLYRWQEVAEWLFQQGKIPQTQYDIATVASRL